MRSIFFWVFLLCFVRVSVAFFSKNFMDFLIYNYGYELANRLSRSDLGERGSFGGTSLTSQTKSDPIILVHGVTSYAGQLTDIRDQFFAQGAPEGSVYATTYGDGGWTEITNVAIECSYVQQVRDLIRAVSQFTKRKVDVIAYSMGSPVARKAILGGRCVGSEVDLGPPLTPFIDTFVSVAGANWGSFTCSLAMNYFPVCNPVNGLSCNSAYIKNVNAIPHYEGTFVFEVFSPDDEYVNVNPVCNVTDTSLPRADQKFTRSGSHLEVIHGTFNLQYQLVTKNKATKPQLDLQSILSK